MKILDRLAYALCIMVPNEDFAELIRRGTPVELDEEDLAVLRPLSCTSLMLKEGTGAGECGMIHTYLFPCPCSPATPHES